MATVNAYLIFNGNCEEAFNFYKSVFGGEFLNLGRYKDMPNKNGKSCAQEDEEKIMHVSFPIGKSSILMGSDSSEDFEHAIISGNNFSLSINADSKEESIKIFNSLSAGGLVEMPMNDTFWGAYFGMLTDQYGVKWIMNFNSNEKNNKNVSE